MRFCKRDRTPLLTHWNYVFLALTHRCVNATMTSWELIMISTTNKHNQTVCMFYGTYSVVPLKHGQFSAKYPQETSHSLPVRARYEVYFVRLNSDLCSASVTAMMYVISYYTGLCYNSTWLYWKPWITRPNVITNYTRVQRTTWVTSLQQCTKYW